jgi:hypothetical protein
LRHSIVPEEHLERDEAEPEDDEDERRREVLVRRRVPDDSGRRHDEEQAERERAEDGVEDGALDDLLEPG